MMTSQSKVGVVQRQRKQYITITSIAIIIKKIKKDYNKTCHYIFVFVKKDRLIYFLGAENKPTK